MVPLYRLTGEKCNFCTYFVTGAPNGPPYTLTGKKCNFCTYIVSSAPNGPSIYAEWGKVQFLHLLCYWSSKWSPYTCWLVKSAISAPTLSVVLQKVPLYRLTGGKCKSCSKFLKFPYFGHTLQLGHQMVPHTGWLLKWPHFVPTLSLSHRMIPWSPVQRLIVEIAIFWPHLLVKSAVFVLLCNLATKWSTIWAEKCSFSS